MGKKYKNRVELHCHTVYSTEDGTASIEDIINFAMREGMTSVAFTDHGNVSAYPEIQQCCELREGFKPIYGMEGYVVNDIDLLGENLYGSEEISIDTDVVVVDLETTGFSPLTEEIIEIAAVRITNGQIADKFHTFVRPSKVIPEHISTLTGIDDLMVKDADTIENILPEFLEFIGNSIIVAHSAQFDLGFIEESAIRSDIPFNYRSIDTVTLSRLIWPKLKRHSLDALMGICSVSADNRHRAIDDAVATAKVYLKMIEKLKKKGLKTIGDIIGSIADCDEIIRSCPSYHITILAKNKQGISDLYKLVTDSNLRYFNSRPRISISDLLNKRDNLLIGSACEAGLLGRSIRSTASYRRIEKIASAYDFLEIQPESELLWMVENPREDNIHSVEDIRNYTDRIIELGEKLHKTVVAISDVHYLKLEDAVSRSAMMANLGYEDPTRVDNLYFRSTEEMLQEFSYLGDDKAYEIVVENSNKVAEQIDFIRPLGHE